MPLPMNQVESPTQPKPYSTAPLTDFPQVTAHASGRIVINSLLRPQPLAGVRSFLQFLFF